MASKPLCLTELKQKLISLNITLTFKKDQLSSNESAAKIK